MQKMLMITITIIIASIISSKLVTMYLNRANYRFDKTKTPRSCTKKKLI
jgi:hypothetical protein